MRLTTPSVIESCSPPIGYPYACTVPPMSGSVSRSVSGGWDEWNDARSPSRRRRSTARSMPRAIATSSARRRSALCGGCTKICDAYSTTCALVRIISPSMTKPDPVNSSGGIRVHGASKSGPR